MNTHSSELGFSCLGPAGQPKEPHQFLWVLVTMASWAAPELAPSTLKIHRGGHSPWGRSQLPGQDPGPRTPGTVGRQHSSFPRGCSGAEGPASPCPPQRVGSPPARPDPVSASLPPSASGTVMPWAGRWPCSGCISSHPCEIPPAPSPAPAVLSRAQGKALRSLPGSTAVGQRRSPCSDRGECRGRAEPSQDVVCAGEL